MITTSYTEARERLAELLERTVRDCEVVEIRRRGRESVAMIAMSELRSLLETAYLLQSPMNAERLLSALKQAQKKTGEVMDLNDLDARLLRTENIEQNDMLGAVGARKRSARSGRITAKRKL